MKEFAEKYAPTKTGWFRAAISAIPAVGGALDRVLFDKLEARRNDTVDSKIDNLELSLLLQPNIDTASRIREIWVTICNLGRISFELDGGRNSESEFQNKLKELKQLQSLLPKQTELFANYLGSVQGKMTQNVHNIVYVLWPDIIEFETWATGGLRSSEIHKFFNDRAIGYILPKIEFLEEVIKRAKDGLPVDVPSKDDNPNVYKSFAFGVAELNETAYLADARSGIKQANPKDSF